MKITLKNVLEVFESEKNSIPENRIIHLSPIIKKNKTSNWFKKMRETKWFVVSKEIEFETSFGKTFIIPKGFITDLSTVPKWLWGVCPPFGDFVLAAIIHDYLYVTKPCSKKVADKEMLIWSKVLNSDTTLNRIDNYLRYWVVKHLGFKVWRRGIKNEFNN